ncbi:MAG TPA: carboxypeptidase regulatory-like domain-containing protein, partial [Isosphaeraceae bacterium]
LDAEDEPRTLTTDAAGALRIPDKGFGRRWRLFLVARPDELTIGWAGLGHPTDRSGTADDPLTVKLEPRDSSITGTVVDRAGKPIAGVEVRVESMHDETNGWLSTYGVTCQGWPIVAVSDERGRYTIPVPRGTRGGMRVRHRRYVGPWIGFETDREPLPTTLDPAGGIVGVVTDAATGRPVAGVSVGAQLLEHRERILGGWGDAKTDDRGRFEIAGLEAGVYNVLFMPRPRGRTSITAAAVEAIRVKPDEDTKADLTAIEGRKLLGSVIDPDTKAPLAGVMVGYYGTARPRSGAGCMSAVTDAAGRFELSVPPGPSYVYIMDETRIGHTSERDVVVPDDRDPEPVQLPGKAKAPPEQPAIAIGKAAGVPQPKAAPKGIVRQDLVEPPGPVTLLTGRVVDPEGQPIPGVLISHGDGRRRFVQAASDREGEFILEGLPEGPVKIELRKQGYPTSIELVGEDVGTGIFILGPKPKAERKSSPAPPDLPKDLRFIDLQPKANELLDQG